MNATELVTPAFALAALTGLFTLSAALGSQAITARGNLKSKRLELAFTQKTTAYREFLVALSDYVHARQKPGNTESEYRVYLRAMAQASLVASAAVSEILQGHEFAVSVAALRNVGDEPTEATYTEAMGRLMDNCVEPLQELMRDDLSRLGGL